MSTSAELVSLSGRVEIEADQRPLYRAHFLKDPKSYRAEESYNFNLTTHFRELRTTN